MLTLQTLIENLPRVGKITIKRFKKLGLKNLEDLIFYFPSRHEDWSSIVPIGKLTYSSVATCRGKVELIKNTRSYFKRKNITEAFISDNTGSIKAVWFNQPYLVKILKVGDGIFLSGRVDFDRFGLHFVSPSFEKEKKDGETVHTARIIPIYSVTEHLTQKQIRFLIKLVLPLVQKIKDWLPEEIKRDLRLIDIKEALYQIHFPDSKIKLNQAKRRLKFDELFLIQLKNLLIKFDLQKSKAPNICFREEETKKFVCNLSFQITDAQRKASWEILQDINKSQPMNRLLEGDVGSGKTIVAAIAALNVIFAGHQVVFMAPTEILARQHYNTFCKLFDLFGVKIGLLTSSEKLMNQKLKMGKKKADDSKLIIHNSDLIIGTHALIQKKVSFENLGLAIVDEQHRFGVEQRKALRENGGETCPHFLSMTATPIPRTMSLIFYGDLDLSILDELPKGRKKIITKVVSPENRDKAYEFIRQEIKNGRQVFVICPLIDPSDKLGVKSAKDEFKKLNQEIFSDLRVGLLHGRMKAKEKEKVMRDFLENNINILVSTSVIEVGVDVPNATIMMIEGAERFGLAQLHQFRGRVGRSIFQSYCLLFSDNDRQEAITRLNFLAQCDDGFILAERDLESRGPGEIFGTRQHGLFDLKLATANDYQIIREAKEAAEKIIKKDPELRDWPDLKKKMDEVEKKIHLE